MIYHVTLSAKTRKEADIMAHYVSDWEDQFPEKPCSFVYNASAVMLNGIELTEYNDDSGPYRATFLFECAADAVLFKLRYNNGEGAC